MKKNREHEKFSAEESARRRDAITRAMIATPPKPHRPIVPKRKKNTTSKVAKARRSS